MKIQLNNAIQIDDQTELIHEVYEGELVDKAGSRYLIYHNNDKEKVVIKFKAGELVMTRFGQPQTLMRFVAGGQAPASIPTPMGVQQLVTATKSLVLDDQDQKIRVSYDLLTSPEADLPLASYTLTIRWGD